MDRMIGQHDNIGVTRQIFNENIEQENLIINIMIWIYAVELAHIENDNNVGWIHFIDP